MVSRVALDGGNIHANLCSDSQFKSKATLSSCNKVSVFLLSTSDKIKSWSTISNANTPLASEDE